MTAHAASRTVVITGAAGFIGRHAQAAFSRLDGVSVIPITRQSGDAALGAALQRADHVIHLAGVNRPGNPEEFAVNERLTRAICDCLARRERAIPVVLASSTQAGNAQPYGQSKLAAERVVRDYAAKGGAGIIFRLPNVFGKWCRPNYNSVVATFAHAIATAAPYTISDPAREITLVHVSDVVAGLLRTFEIPIGAAELREAEITPQRVITLGGLAEALEGFRRHRETLLLPSFDDSFTRQLYSTYMSYLPQSEFGYNLATRTDARGSLAEFLKSPIAGQIFVSRTKPGVTRGNHWHEVKVEKFLVLAGEAVIRFRPIDGTEIVEYRVRGEDFRVVDIPPGYTHSIENVGGSELVTLFWAIEIFDPDHPDTFALEVKHAT